MRIVFATLSLLFWTFAAAAQDYPEPLSKTVNDFSGVIPEGAEARLKAQLEQLFEATGVEMTVVTLVRQADHDTSRNFEEFATHLFNTWGVGNAERNDGVMVLHMLADQRIRLELGKGYGDTWNSTAREIVETDFIPPFKNYNIPEGLEDGVKATIEQIVLPHHRGKSDGISLPDTYIEEGLILALLGFFGFRFFRRRFAKCPNCGARKLRKSSKVLRKPRFGQRGETRDTTRCQNCDYRNSITRQTRFFQSSSSGSSSSFGGGSSSGGGASGRW